MIASVDEPSKEYRADKISKERKQEVVRACQLRKNNCFGNYRIKSNYSYYYNNCDLISYQT